MFRLFARWPRSVRVPIENGPVDVQKVEVTRKSKPVFRRYFLNFFLTFCAIRTISYVTSDDFKKTRAAWAERVEEIKKQRQNGNSQSGKKDQPKQPPTTSNGADDHLSAESANVNELLKRKDVAAITLPIYFRKRMRRMYTENDPQWKAIAELQRDPKRFSELKVKVAKDVTAQLVTYEHQANLAYVHFNKGASVYLEIIPPTMTPVTYEVPCIFITPSSVALKWRPMSPMASTRTERIFHPMIFANAFSEGLMSFYGTSYLITKARFLDMFNKNKSIRLQVTLVGQGARQRLVSMGLERDANEEEKLRQKMPTSRLNEKMGKIVFPFLRGDYGSEGSRKGYRDFVHSMTYKDAIEQATGVFNSRWISANIATLQENTPGACIIKGYVDCIGTKGRYRLEVEAFYVPADNAFVGMPRITNQYVVADINAFNQQAGVPKVTQPNTIQVQSHKATRQTNVGRPKSSEPGKSPSQAGPAPSPEKPPQGKMQGSDKDR